MSKKILTITQKVFSMVYVSEYDFTIVVDGEEHSASLGLEKNGIRFHFLRYGLLRKGAYDNEVSEIYFDGTSTKAIQKDGQAIQDVKAVEEIDYFPHTENFHIVRTPLDEGYIYILDFNSSDFWEYKVESDGSLKEVIWETGSGIAENDDYFDRRAPIELNKEDAKYNFFKEGTIPPFESGKVLNLAYSRVQWSVAVFKKMRDDLHERYSRMGKREFTGIDENSDDPCCTSYKDVTVYFYSADTLSHASLLHRKLNKIHTRKDKENKNTGALLDVFFTFYDYIGCANDIAAEFKKERIRLDAIVESIQTGRDDRDIFSKMLHNEYERGILNDTEIQLHALFLITHSAYQMVYNSEDTIKKYDGRYLASNPNCDCEEGLYKDKLMELLGKEFRRQQRAVMYRLRDDFLSWLDSDYYQNIWSEYKENTDTNSLTGQDVLLEHLLVLSIFPHDVDRFLDLGKEYELDTIYYGEDPAQKFIDKLQQAGDSNPLNAILYKKINIAKLVGKTANITSKLGRVLRNGILWEATESFDLGSFSTLNFVESKMTGELLMKLMENPQNYTVNSKDLVTAYVSKADKRLATLMIGDGRWLSSLGSAELTNELSDIQNDNLKLVIVERGSLFPDEVERTLKILGNKSMLVGLSLVQSLHLLFFGNQSLEKVRAGTMSNSDLTSVIANTTISTIQLAENILLIKRARLISQGANPILKTNKAFTVFKTARTLGRVGGLLQAALSIKEALNSANNGNLEAAILWSMASGAALLAFIPGPVGIIFLLLSVACSIAASYLKKDPLEIFFMKYILSDEVDLSDLLTADEIARLDRPFLYAEKMLDKKDSLMESTREWLEEKYPIIEWFSSYIFETDAQEWEDFRLAYEHFTELTVFGGVKAKAENNDTFSVIDTNYNPYGHSIPKEYHRITKYSVDIFFQVFVQDSLHLKPTIYHFKNGLGHGKAERLINYNHYVELSLIQGGVNAMFSIEEEVGDILFICRLKLLNYYFPFNLDELKFAEDDERLSQYEEGKYIGIVLPVVITLNSPAPPKPELYARVKIDSKRNLINGTAWS